MSSFVGVFCTVLFPLHIDTIKNIFMTLPGKPKTSLRDSS